MNAYDLTEAPLSLLWDGDAMREHRRRMTSAEPPAACLACPRF